MRRFVLAFVCALPLLAAHQAGAADLLQAWQAAQQNDPEFAASIAAREAGAANERLGPRPALPCTP